MTPQSCPRTRTTSALSGYLSRFNGLCRLFGLLALAVSMGCGKSTPPQAPAAGSAATATTNSPAASSSSDDAFLQLSNSGRNYYERGDAERAVTFFTQALQLQPANIDAILNLANALLVANRPEEALKQATAAVAIDANQPAAQYLMGCSLLRQGQFEAAIKAFQNAKTIDRTVNEVSFQLGRAYQGVNQHEAAAAEFEEVVKFDSQHRAAYYALSQSLLRLGKQAEAQTALEGHQKVNAGKPPQITNPSTFEASKYTAVRVPFKQRPPDATGINVRFVEATASFLGASASAYRGPVAIVDLGASRNSLLLRESDQAWRVLGNTNGILSPAANPIPVKAGARFHRALVGDLNNDRADDVLMLGEGGSQAFKFTTNGAVADATAFANLRTLSATNGVLVDYLFTGNAGLLAVGYGTNNLRFLRNLGSMYFSTNMTNIGIPFDLQGARQVVVDDWNGDDLLDLFVQRDGLPPLLLTKHSGAPLTATNSPADWPVASAIATGDVDNDGRTDLVTLSPNGVEVISGLSGQRTSIPVKDVAGLNAIALIDYDNDGWLDVVATGNQVRVWRNRWKAGYQEATEALSLGGVRDIAILQAVDLDHDGDLEFVVTHPDQTIAILRNDGGNANQLLKIKLLGNKSNGSGLGVKVEVSTSDSRIVRRVQSLPTEIGVGTNSQIDSINVRWFTLNVNTVDVKVDPKNPLRIDELTISDTSCPYLYVWDGTQYRFVSDILGAAPIGLPFMEGRYIQADADEIVWLGDERNVRPREGRFMVSITEELREVLYLDETKLLVADHPEGTEIHPTDKLLPKGPFPPGELVTLEHRHPLLKATRLDGADVTEALVSNDGVKVSPTKLLEHQLRGRAERHGVILDFGPLDTTRPLVLALTGWLRFGGAMANLAISLREDLGYPFPVLEAETAGGVWQKLDLEPGAPAGKTKTILMDLAGKIPTGARRLRLSTEFEIHWDRIALWERRMVGDTRITEVAPSYSNLHWRGFGEIAALPWTEPQTPVYERVQANPPWRITPGGWATRYGAVDELIRDRDNALAMINSGDELFVGFAEERIPAKAQGMQRDFFLQSVGWDKDGDFHVARRDSFEPLPWHGMDDQRHGQQARPAFPNDAWIQKYNTRWCSPQVLTRLHP